MCSTKFFVRLFWTLTCTLCLDYQGKLRDGQLDRLVHCVRSSFLVEDFIYFYKWEKNPGISWFIHVLHFIVHQSALAHCGLLNILIRTSVLYKLISRNLETSRRVWQYWADINIIITDLELVAKQPLSRKGTFWPKEKILHEMWKKRRNTSMWQDHMSTLPREWIR